MGGDNAPRRSSPAQWPPLKRKDIVLVGDEVICKDLLAEHGATLPVVHASEVIGMGEDAGKGVREKPDASVVRCARLVRHGEVGFVSAGSTGAAMAAASVVIGRARGVQRAASPPSSPRRATPPLSSTPAPTPKSPTTSPSSA